MRRSLLAASLLFCLASRADPVALRAARMLDAERGALIHPTSVTPFPKLSNADARTIADKSALIQEKGAAMSAAAVKSFRPAHTGGVKIAFGSRLGDLIMVFVMKGGVIAK